MKAAVVVFPGSNREGDALRALRRGGAEATTVWHGEHDLPAGTDLAVLPGGFSYGDYLRCGAIAARSPIMDAIRAHASRGGLVLGICNGFQILVESGLLPGVLMRNANLRFVCRLQHLRVERADTPFTARYAAGQAIEVAIAHGEGNYTADPETVRRLEDENRVAFRYCDAERPREGPGLAQRLDARDRRDLLRKPARARDDAAPREPRRPALRRHRRPALVPEPGGLGAAQCPRRPPPPFLPPPPPFSPGCSSISAAAIQ